MVRGGVPPLRISSNQTADRESDHVRRICHAPGEQGAKFISIKLSWLGAHDVCQRADLRTAPAQTRDLLTMEDVLEMINERTSSCNAALSLIASIAMTSASKD
jgi:hypothetical protein